MLDFSQITFKALAVHRVGNKLREEGVLANEELYNLSDESFRNVLLDYFLKPFKKDEYYRFTHEADLSLNEVYLCCQEIFSKRATILDQSVKLAKHLYQQSTHPKVQGGELYVTYFADCVMEDEVVDAIGIFKSENKDVYLKANEKGDQVMINYEQGINIKKLDKGCLIFNTFGEEGYRVMIVDKKSRVEEEAQYWKADFLQLARVHDNSFNTESYLFLCQEFCDEVFTHDTGGKKEEVVFLNKSINYFTEHDNFDIEDFATEVIEDPKHIERFKEFKNDYEHEYGLVTKDDFRISQPAVKTMKRKFKKFIELDTQVDIKIKDESADQYIERGYDEQRAMYYYKVYFRDEF